MYQPYPTGGEQQVPALAGPPRPVRTAVKLMYAGAALSAIEIIVGLSTISSLKSSIHRQYPQFTASQLHSFQVVTVAVGVVLGLLAVGLWIWMAVANGAGRNWARIVASALFGLNTIDLLALVARPHAALGLVLAIAVWLAGLGAIVLLWRRESSAYFQAKSAQPR